MRDSVEKMEKILVSACLMGQKVRYDGSDACVEDPLLESWHREGRLVTYCPEVASGFPTPRAPAEISSRDGSGVLDGGSGVFQDDGEDVTAQFLKAAHMALSVAQRVEA